MKTPGIPQYLSNVVSNFILSEGNHGIFVHFLKATMKLIIDLTVSPRPIAEQFFRAQNSYEIVVILFWPNQCCWNGSPFCFNKAEHYPVLDETDKFRLFSVKLILLLVFQHWGFFPSSDLRKGSLAVKDRNIRHSFSVFMLCNLLSVWPLTSHLISLWFNFLPLKTDIMLTFTHPLCFSFNLLAV